MKRLFKAIIATASVTMCSIAAFAQANDWILPPNTKIHFTTSSATATSLGTTAIAGCGAGSGYIQDQRARTITDATGNGMTFVDYCGAYSLPTVSNISSYSMQKGYQNVFAVPGLCKTYYAINWEGTGGMLSTSKLTVRILDASNPATLTETGSVDLLNDGTVHYFTAIAVSPLAANGTRRIYVADGTSFKYVQISANGTIGALMTLRTGIDQVDDRSGFKVVANGTKILMGAVTAKVKLYDIAKDSFVFSHTFAPQTVISGLEYLPYRGTGGDRIYASYHFWNGTTAGDTFAYISYNAPAPVWKPAATTYPGGYAAFGFGYSDIERGKNGKLYIAFNSNFSSHTVLSGSGALCVLDTAGTGTLTEVKIAPSTPVYTYNYISNWGFVIQKQIDGENYDLTNYVSPAPIFNINNIRQFVSYQAPDLYICNGTLPLQDTINGYHTSFTIKIETGTFSGLGGFVANATQPAGNSVTINNTTTTETTDLLPYFSFINATSGSYTGFIRVTVSANNTCNNVSSKSQVFNFKGAVSVISSFKMNRYVNNRGTGSTAYTKAVKTFLPIPDSTMPVPNTRIDSFRARIDRATGWIGASTTMGIGGITTTGEYVAVKVYEAGSNGKRREINGDPAPDIYFYADSVSAIGSSVNLNSSTYTFDGTNPPYYCDTNGQYDDANWFIRYYNWAFINAKLTEYSAKQYCVEMVVSTSTGCTDTNRGYFRIANNGAFSNGADAKPGPAGVAGIETTDRIEVYPNPAQNTLNFVLPKGATEGMIVITDISGRLVLRQHLESNNPAINIAQIPAGIYIYGIVANDRTYHGKFIRN